MFPNFNSPLCNPNNQLQWNGTNALAPQQVMGNQGNLGQIRPQFQVGALNNPLQVGALNNPQLAMPPFADSNPYFAPNQNFPFAQGPFPNPISNLPQILANNTVNPSQFLLNGQLNVPNLVHNVSQLLQMQMMNLGPQNLGLFVNPQSSGGNNNGVVPQLAAGNAFNHMNHDAAVTKDFGSHKVQGNENLLSPGAVKSQSNAGVVNEVNNRSNNWGRSHSKNFAGSRRYDASQRGFGNRQLHHRQNAQGHRQNAQGNLNVNNENRGKGNKNIGVKNFNLSNPSEQIQLGKKRSALVNYTEQEIKQWREERKKNFPSKANMEKKLKENGKEPGATDGVSKIRRQQLKEILAKQAELGCEVAEIPYSYLSDSEQDTGCRKQNNKVFGQRESFHNKFDKKGKFQQKFDKGKFHQSDRLSKRQRPGNKYSANLQNQNDCSTKKQRLTNGHTANLHTENKGEPSLLKKLLSSDIKKDKRHILQVFRFMLMNSFFKVFSETPLKFPVVIVKESGDESEILDEKPEVKRGDTVCNGDKNDSISAEGDAQDEDESGREVGEIME